MSGPKNCGKLSPCVEPKTQDLIEITADVVSKHESLRKAKISMNSKKFRDQLDEAEKTELDELEMISHCSSLASSISTIAEVSMSTDSGYGDAIGSRSDNVHELMPTHPPAPLRMNFKKIDKNLSVPDSKFLACMPYFAESTSELEAHLIEKFCDNLHHDALGKLLSDFGAGKFVDIVKEMAQRHFVMVDNFKHPTSEVFSAISQKFSGGKINSADLRKKFYELTKTIDPESENHSVHARENDSMQLSEHAGPSSRQPTELYNTWLGRAWKIRENQMNCPNNFEPCHHDGPCDKNCKCVDDSNFCEKYCSCSKDCKNKYRGCHCALGTCGTDKCTCFNYARECDVNLCKCHTFNCELPTDQQKPSWHCKNMNIQLGHSKKIEVKLSNISGYGAFACEDIKKGDFIHQYVGEKISIDEAKRRDANYNLQKLNYLFELNEQYEIDATKCGNVMRFVNSSDGKHQSNVVPKVVMVEGDHLIAFFAKTDIESGEELLYDYGYSKDIKLLYNMK